MRSNTGHAGSWDPGRYPMLMRNSPVISPPVKRNVFLNSRTQSSFDLGWWDASQSATEP